MAEAVKLGEQEINIETLPEQMPIPKGKWPAFAERMNFFVDAVPPALRYSKMAAYHVKEILFIELPLLIHTEYCSVMFKEPDGVIYMQVGRECYIDHGDFIAAIVKVTANDWSISFARFVPGDHGEYRHTKNYGQPEKLSTAFFEYRDDYLAPIERKEREDEYYKTHPRPDPEPCLKAFPKETVQPGWFMRILMKLFPG